MQRANFLTGRVGAGKKGAQVALYRRCHFRRNEKTALIKRGFPHRIGYADVHGRYAPLLRRLGDSGQPHLAKLAALPPRALVEAVLASQGLHAPAEYVLGKERVFLGI